MVIKVSESKNGEIKSVHTISSIVEKLSEIAKNHRYYCADFREIFRIVKDNAQYRINDRRNSSTDKADYHNFLC